MSIKETENEPVIDIQSNWAAQSKGLQEQYPLLSDADLHYEKGKENELLIRIETRLNMSRTDVILLLKKDMIIVAEPK